jgi:hypothetical protein
MLFQFFRHQLQRERPTISATVRRTSENGQMDIGGNMRVEMVSDVSSPSAAPVVIAKERHDSAAKKD